MLVKFTTAAALYESVSSIFSIPQQFLFAFVVKSIFAKLLFLELRSNLHTWVKGFQMFLCFYLNKHLMMRLIFDSRNDIEKNPWKLSGNLERVNYGILIRDGVMLSIFAEWEDSRKWCCWISDGEDLDGSVLQQLGEDLELVGLALSPGHQDNGRRLDVTPVCLSLI